MFGAPQFEFCLVHLPMSNKQRWGDSEREQFRAAIEWATAEADRTHSRLNLTGLQLPEEIHLRLKPRFGLIMSGANSTVGYSDLFAGTIFEGDVSIGDVQFTGSANFVGSEFHGSKTAIHVNAAGSVIFNDCVFRGDTHLNPIRGQAIELDRAQFLGTATLAFEAQQQLSLRGARFHKEMSGSLRAARNLDLDTIECRGVAVLGVASTRYKPTTFRDARFTEGVDFLGSMFEGPLIFDGTQVGKSARFDYVIFNGRASFERCVFGGEVSFIGAEGNPQPGTGNCLQDVSFAGSAFGGRAVFRNRHLKATANFKDCLFAKAPEFHGADIHQAVQFPKEVAFGDTTSEYAAPSYRTLKLAMEKNRARQEEAMFYALEQRSLRHTPGEMGWWERSASYIYDKMARYGQSFGRPLICLAGSWLLFALGYACWMGAPVNCSAPIDFKVLARGVMFSTEQVFNPFGIWKKSAQDLGGLTTAHFSALQLVATLQSLISAGFAALFILGLRWRFKRE